MKIFLYAVNTLTFLNKSPYSKDSHSVWPTSTLQGCSVVQLVNKSPHPKGSHSVCLAHFSTPRCPFFAAFVEVSLSQGQPFSLSHFNTARSPLEQVRSFQEQPFSLAHFNNWKCPLSVAFKQVYLSQGQPLQNFKASIHYSIWTSLFVPRTTILSGPLQQLKMSTPCSQ